MIASDYHWIRKKTFYNIKTENVNVCSAIQCGNLHGSSMLT